MSYSQEDPFAVKDSLRFILLVFSPALLVGAGLVWLGFEEEITLATTIGHNLLVTTGIWMICRSYVRFLWRRFPWDKDPVIHIVLEVIGIGLFSFLYWWGLYKLELALHLVEPTESETFFLVALITILITYLITGIHEMIYFYKQWILHFSKSVRLEKDSIEARYETLKTQVNPHFLFNSLNSLVSIVDENPKAVSYIQNLSEFLRYMLGSHDTNLVLLRDEIKVLNYYFELQKSRFLENLVVNLEIQSKYLGYSVPPLVLQMLVENCIKHNIISQKKTLQISITTKENSIEVRNNLQRKTEVDSTGHGLMNIIQRYRFFTRREVRIHETTSFFSVTVPLLKEEK